MVPILKGSTEYKAAAANQRLMAGSPRICHQHNTVHVPSEDPLTTKAPYKDFMARAA
jgi:hypothetical protein